MAFVDRIVEHPNRVRLTSVSDDVYDLTREEGTVTEAGTPLDAEHLNAEMAVAVANKLTLLTFESLTDMETQWTSLSTSTVYAFHGTATWTSQVATAVGGSYQANGIFCPVSSGNVDMLFFSNGHLWAGRHARGSVASGDFARID